MTNADMLKVAELARFVSNLIEITGKAECLDENTINDSIEKAILISGKTYTDEERETALRDITARYQVRTDPGQSIVADYEQGKWYDDRKSEIEPFFWSRYRNYLIDEKHFSPSVVSILGDDTLDQKLMNYILDPDIKTNQPLLRRGLIIGDVQSGKTSTYIGFICKAADAGYKVFILLTGVIESLRKQTQERVEEGFIGMNMSADETTGKRVGVGLDNKPIKAMSLTSRKNDFTGNNDKNVISLLNSNNAVVFVIKKNTTSLTKLKNWLVTLNADPSTKKINLPMLLIDDEADNASINTSKDKEDPTKINRLIRELANVFTKSNYVGFTATPFANVFIDPETTEKMETQDLFPEDFIVALPTPSNYIGAEKIFEKDGEYRSQIIYINDAGREEADGFPFYFLHKKEWRGELPDSLTDAIYTFYLVNAIRDLRGDSRQHRSMLINISRFVKVQKYIKEEIEEIHARAYRSVKFNLCSNFEESMKDPVLKRIYDNWEKQYINAGETWENISAILLKSIENIQIRVVNSSKAAEKIEYPADESLRVIAIGGLALSRGLTLEGLVVSYFYRNTSTYDVLMQMGRWFGYRKGYEDLFRIWIHKLSAEWYAEISEATRLLKDDMHIMRENEMKPKDFGIRVRNNSAELSITAYNKMRNATDEYEVSSYFGGFIETPYLMFNAKAHKENYYAVEKLVNVCLDDGMTFDREKLIKGTGRYIIRDIPKHNIIALMSQLKISRFSDKFDTNQIYKFLSMCEDSSIDYFDMAFIEGDPDTEPVKIGERSIYPVKRNHCVVDSVTDRLGVGRRGKLAGTLDGKAGIADFNGKTADEIINKAKDDYCVWYKKVNGIEFDRSRSFPSDMWFKFIKDRKPIILVYFIEVGIDPQDSTQEKQISIFNEEMRGMPAVGFAMGLPRNDEQMAVSATRFKANKVYNWFERDEYMAEGEDE
ncbi:MAG: Z1 domain-containing protein [Lachnospiraceae bacterium]|nr:Z1 domain-containing protein [Lachnospiraceae bacterium]